MYQGRKMSTQSVAELLTRITNLEIQLEEMQILYDNKCDELRKVTEEFSQFRSETSWSNDRNQLGCF